MKKSIVIFTGIALLSLFVANTFGIGFNTKNGNGIAFHQGTWSEALASAKKENKLIFLDISASWCPPCRMLKARTFPNSEVGTFFNANFINVEVDGEKGEGVGLAHKYRIMGYPSLIFVNGNGEVVAQTAGYHNPKEFVELGKKVIQR
ncbi:MAG: thioredoxin fold domain-containing protein [Prolixibacteraceae bacterium]|jgi:thioredoxin-related protein|nr:thioredoxin fold domain-containing protein [Prolixibacteraceae bacterium]